MEIFLGILPSAKPFGQYVVRGRGPCLLGLFFRTYEEGRRKKEHNSPLLKVHIRTKEGKPNTLNFCIRDIVKLGLVLSLLFLENLTCFVPYLSLVILAKL